jgi:hypothetical protein
MSVGLCFGGDEKGMVRPRVVDNSGLSVSVPRICLCVYVCVCVCVRVGGCLISPQPTPLYALVSTFVRNLP